MNRERIFLWLGLIVICLLALNLGYWIDRDVNSRIARHKLIPNPATTDVRRAFNAGVLIGSAEALRYAMESATNRPVRLQGTNVLNTIYQRAYDMFPEFRPPAK